VEEAKADFAEGLAWAKYDPEKTSPEEIVEAVNENTAFEAKLPEKEKK
jgi:copper chaperone CopZ